MSITAISSGPPSPPLTYLSAADGRITIRKIWKEDCGWNRSDDPTGDWLRTYCVPPGGVAPKMEIARAV